MKEHGGSIDYIHGADVARDLAARPGNIAFLLPAMGKEQLFPPSSGTGCSPQDLLHGEAHDKRFTWRRARSDKGVTRCPFWKQGPTPS